MSVRGDATPQSGESDGHGGETCTAPSCWRDGRPVRVGGETAVEAVLCETHEKAYLQVSS